MNIEQLSELMYKSIELKSFSRVNRYVKKQTNQHFSVCAFMHTYMRELAELGSSEEIKDCIRDTKEMIDRMVKKQITPDDASNIAVMIAEKYS